MSFPNLPDVDPEVDIKIEDAINLLLASIAFEELGLAHIINAEAEKIQFVLGTLHEKKAPDKHDKHHKYDKHDKHDKCEICPTIEDLKEIDRSVERVLKNIIKKEMILEFKLENVIELSESTKKDAGKCKTSADDKAKCTTPAGMPKCNGPADGTVKHASPVADTAKKDNSGCQFQSDLEFWSR